MEWAKDNGGITGENIKKGMYVHDNWVPQGLEGVCVPANWHIKAYINIFWVNGELYL